MKTRKWISILCAVCVAAGCSKSAFKREDLAEQIGVKMPVYDESEIRKEFEKKPNLPNPFKVGVYFKTPATPKGSVEAWRWTEKDKAFLDDFQADLKAQGVTAEVFPILHHVVKDEDLRALRMTAARHHADALLVVAGAGEIERGFNNWGWTYMFILPALVIPASETETLFMTNATLWDVRNEYLYMTAEAEGIVGETHAAAFGKKDKDLLNEAKSRSLANLKGELAKMFKSTQL